MKSVKYNVYPIVSGCSTESIFTGTDKQCRKFVKAQKVVDPSFDWILLEDH